MYKFDIKSNMWHFSAIHHLDYAYHGGPQRKSEELEASRVFAKCHEISFCAVAVYS